MIRVLLDHTCMQALADGYNANDCTSSIAAGHGEYRDLGPINSLHLRPHYN
ncbi:MULTISPECIES: hypothetical protein [unclassified Streptomyces]|uniref:hypothetical protein n=1 Tax=unclassified Streptomyces TaxID=2593676 RepID=UPI002256979E|nr:MULTISPECIES: hypothetical protein [unclassified Streptomyces]MCX5338234.1 hypothetical protein [Streptomyces sp. NBC_00140]MCX5367375.1 hypothetical protein [Streptomyces sp. NBC_00124]